MTKSTITRERLQEIAEDGFLKHGESKELARMALAAMDSEPHTDDELSNLLWYSQEATCHSDPNYYCEFQRLATPGLIAGIIRELQERRKAAIDSEPVGKPFMYGIADPDGNAYIDEFCVSEDLGLVEDTVNELNYDREEGDELHYSVVALYLHAQPAPVVQDGYVMVPMRLTAENGAKGALSGEFSETKFVNCPECFGDDECETCDGSGRIEITIPVTWTTIKEIWAKGVEHFAAAPQEVKP